jgi:hypothetical protein
MATYQIIGFDKATGSIKISFDEKMAPIAIDVPLNEQGVYITGAELDAYIQGFIPTWHLDRINQIAAGIANEVDIESLVQPLPVVEPQQADQQQADQQQATNQSLDEANIWQPVEFEQQIAKVLLKFGVISTDPTKIEVTNL